MGAIKENVYSKEETELFMIGRAIAHPARVKMMIDLLAESTYRNTDLSKLFGMAPSSIKKHIEMLKDAELVGINYSLHYYEISLSPKGRKWSELISKGPL